MIYLDNAATSFPKPQSVYDAVYEHMTRQGASAGRGSYETSLMASETLFICQELLSELFNTPSPERFVFTKNSTEAINTLMFGLLKEGDELIISSMEHNSVARCAHECSKRNISLKIARSSSDGIVSPGSIEKLISPKTKLICLIHASNVTGGINDIYAVQEIATKNNAFALFDCAQTAGVIPIDASGLDMFTFSGHKGLLAPLGTGGFYVREGITPRPLLYGGTGSLSESGVMPDFFPDRFHAGTMNVSAISGMCEGIRFILKEGVFEKEREITDYLYDSLCEIKSLVIPGVRERVGVISVVPKGFDCVLLSQQLSDEYNIATRAGLHCAPFAHRSIGTFATGTVRFSPGFFTKKEDVDFTVSSLKKIMSN